ncbi:MAG: beta-N-acetylhexosaminidase [Neomegalonema sp.]|nr:beta-N-acetylhexosaminidase [Neomegalonema sp.]
MNDNGMGEPPHNGTQAGAARQAPYETAPSGSRAAIVGVSGAALSASEADFLSDAKPWGAILFARNIVSPDQVKALVHEIRAALGWRAPILIDQEGGRVARLRGPHWREWPAVGDWCVAADQGALSEQQLWEALWLRYRLIAAELLELGIDVDCAPLLDLRLPGAHDVIGDRALGATAATVAARAAAIAEGLHAGGVLSVVKHIPGHGRADLDSHAATPRIDASWAELSQTDFAAFAALADLPLGMTAHVIYEAVDPGQIATTSAKVIQDVVREEIGFDGLLMTDDLSMGAMAGGFSERAADALAAGCDIVLHCNGDLAEMQEAMRGVGLLQGDARRRADAAMRARLSPEPFDVAEALARLDALAPPGWRGALSTEGADA